MNISMKKRERTHKVRNLIVEHVNSNLKEYIIVFVIFIVGIIIGMALLQNLSDTQKNELSGYMYSIIDSLKEQTEIDTIALLKNSILNNIFLSVIMWFVGSTIIGLPIVYAIVGFKGFSFGYTVSAAIAVLGTGNGMLFSITTMLLQNIIFIPCLLALAVSATKLCKSIFKDRRRENIKFGIIKHTFFSGIICILLIISSFVEVYISTALFNLSLNIL